MHVVLVAPEIHMNTGNIIRLCANTGTVLHLVEPLGFTMESAALRRAGLDYHELAEVHVHRSFESALGVLGSHRKFAFSSRAVARYDEVQFESSDVFVFGAERAGLSSEVLDQIPGEHHLRLPMRPKNRSLNLANSVAIVVFEAWRQQGFTGAAVPGESLPEVGHGLTTEMFGRPPFDT